MQILAGDIGGTNTRLTVYDFSAPQHFTALREKVFPSAEHDSLASILRCFLDSPSPEERIERACFGIAGPVIGQVCEATNLPWRVAADTIRDTFGFNQVWLLNDLEANAWGIEALPPQDLFLLNPGNPQATGNRAIISAGTGLGEAGIYWDGSRYRPFSSEGGHGDFSPANPLEFALHQWLAERYGHVSWERLVSGPGLENLYTFLLHHRGETSPDWLAQRIAEQGMAPAVSQTALEEGDPLCVEALDLFIHLYGREAGNHALKLMAGGGVYLGGGIAPRILPRLQQGGFLRGFFDKGRMRPLLEAMPVRVILNDKAALLGSARFASLQ
ncbi:MAG: glucokinase [Candidatus Thiodiazotropha sp.]